MQFFVASPSAKRMCCALSSEELIKKIEDQELIGYELPMPNFLVKIGVADSTTKARQLIKEGAVTIGTPKQKVESIEDTVIMLFEGNEESMLC